MLEKIKNLFSSKKTTESPVTELSFDEKLPVIDNLDDCTMDILDELSDGRDPDDDYSEECD